MVFMAGPAASCFLRPLGLHDVTQALCAVLLTILVMMNLVLSSNENIKFGALSAVDFPQDKYLHCYRCLLETEESGCLLGSDTCLLPPGSSCFTVSIKNSSGFNVMVSGCHSKEQMVRCSFTRASPVFGFWIYYQCCFLNFCNKPSNRENTMH